MRFVKNLFIGIGAVALAGVTLTLLAPKTVHGAVATLVQVANTAANPAVTQDTTNQAAQIVTLFCTNVSGVQCNQVLPQGSYSDGYYVVPAGQNLVVTSVDVCACAAYPTTLVGNFRLLRAGGVYEAFLLPAGFVNVTYSLGTGVVIGSGIVPGIEDFDPNFYFPPGLSATLHGYTTAN